MHIFHQYQIVGTDRYTDEGVPVTAIRKMCKCGKIKTQWVEGWWNFEQKNMKYYTAIFNKNGQIMNTGSYHNKAELLAVFRTMDEAIEAQENSGHLKKGRAAIIQIPEITK
jgi:hypothetical protein